MSEINVSDYKNFSNAVTTTKNYLQQVTTNKETVIECKTILSDSSVFMGPIADNCKQDLSTLSTDLESILSTFQTVEKLLVISQDEYQTSDKDAADTATNDTTSTTSTPGITPTISSSDIEAKKKAFVGNVDDPNNYDPVKSNFRTMRKKMTLFDNKTGEILQDHATITMKPGETRIITVKLPTDTGMINQIKRTTADGGDAFRSGKYLTARCDIDPNPNNIEYVNYKSGPNGHYPSDSTLLHNNSYDWVITAKSDGTVASSQTCEYSTDVSNGSLLKAMINLNVVVKSDDDMKSS